MTKQRAEKILQQKYNIETTTCSNNDVIYVITKKGVLPIAVFENSNIIELEEQIQLMEELRQ